MLNRLTAMGSNLQLNIISKIRWQLGEKTELLTVARVNELGAHDVHCTIPS